MSRRILELRPQVQAALAHIEGLCNVGIGIRERAGNLYDLVVHRRAVTVAWHRNRGPSFAARLARAIRENTDSLPTEVDGTSLNTMATALRTHGNPFVQHSITTTSWLRDLLVDCTSVSELMRRLETVPGINA